MGNCLKKSPQQTQQIQPLKQQKKIVKQIQQKGLQFIYYLFDRSIIIKCWKQTHNNLFNFNLNDNQLNKQVINVMLKKLRIAKLADQYQALLPNDPQFNKIMPSVMIDVNELKDRDKFGQKKYTFQINEFPKISKPFWLVVKSLPNQRYCLKQGKQYIINRQLTIIKQVRISITEGDIFKMGKVKLRVKQIIHKSSQTKDMNKQIIQTQYKIYNCQGNVCIGEQQYDNDIKCRICMEQADNTNPLLAICHCIGNNQYNELQVYQYNIDLGTSKYTHFKCLKQWFTTQLDPVKINQVTQINWKSLQCELCKSKLPYSIQLDNQIYYLVQFPKFKKPYLVLNPVYKNNNQKSKIYYFISFKKRNRMILGRKSDADIQLCTDATISRHHSVIQYVQKNPNQDGKFYLQDNGSKFGTVVLLHTKHPLMVSPKLNGIQFQVGGDLIRINYKTQNFFHTLSTNQDEIDFNKQQGNFIQFEQQQQDQQINEVGSQQNEKKQSTKQYNRQMVSSIQQQHSMTHQNLVRGQYTSNKFKS